MLKNVYLLADSGADTAENKRTFAEHIFMKTSRSHLGSSSITVLCCSQRKSQHHATMARCEVPASESGRARGRVAHHGRDEPHPPWARVHAGVERFDRRGTEPNELFRSEFGQNSCKIQEFSLEN